jgi:quercetin dioxygenase-like cupin family protein
MARLIEKPTIVQAAGNKPKIIEEYVGRVNTGTTAISIAKMTSPPGWVEPGQTPEFEEYTLVLRGTLVVEGVGSRLEVNAGQVVSIPAEEWVKYSTPAGAEYIAVCIPAFSPGTVHRDSA